MIRIQTYDGELVHAYEDVSILPRRGDDLDLNGRIFTIDRVVFRSRMDLGESLIDIYVVEPNELQPKVPKRKGTLDLLMNKEYLLDFGMHSDWWLFPVEDEAKFQSWVASNTNFVPNDPLDFMIPVASSEKVVISRYRIRD